MNKYWQCIDLCKNNSCIAINGYKTEISSSPSFYEVDKAGVCPLKDFLSPDATETSH